MNLYALPPLLTSLVFVFLSIFVLIKDSRNIFNRIFFLLGTTSAVWLCCYALAFNSSSESTADVLLRIGYCGIIFIAVAFFHYTVAFLDLKKMKTIVGASYLLSLVWIMLFLKTSLLIKGVKRYSWGYYPLAGVLHPLFLIFFIGLVSFALTLLFYFFFLKSKELTSLKRIQIKYLFLAFFVFNFASVDFLPNYGINIYPFGYLPALLFALIIAYVILRYRLIDIRITVTRAGIFIAVYTFVLGLPFALAGFAKGWLIDIYGASWWIIPLAAMAVLATTGPFFYVHLQRKTEEALLKEQRRYQNTLKHAAIGMTRIRNLQKLLSLITHIVTKTVRIDYAAIYLYTAPTNEFTLQVFRDSDRQRHRVPPAKLSADSPMIRWLHLNKDPMIYEEIKRVVQDTPNPVGKQIEEHMRQILASVIIPSFLDQKLSGFIVLGDKMSGQIYTSDDLNVFQVLASQAALAIENAQFYEDAKEMQAQIAQAEKMATIGTMADGLSHQINNRFYALSLIAGDTIDTIKLTDTQKCSPEIQEMIKNINSALEKIQVNVTQGGEVVKGILKYTRKGDHKLDPISLDQIIDATLEMVKYKVKLAELDIIREYPPETPKITGNLVQMQEVFFNFIDNAYDAIVERRNTLKEDGYRGKITISARPRGDMLEITVQDNGMGVKKEDGKKLFTPFFTTKISARKGTGLGLYVIRNIITEHHGGKIAFDSIHMAGTRFILELPIVKAIS